MKNGNPCNEKNIIGRQGQDRITYTFLTDDGITPSGCCIRIGDIDPLTGKPISDVFFQTYHQIRNQEIYHSNKAERVPFSSEERAKRNQERREIETVFEQEYGYKPDDETVEYLLEERWGSQYNLHIDAFIDKHGESYAERILPLAKTDEEMESPSDEIEILREFAATLTERLLDVYQMMLEKISGGADATQGKDLAKKWGVCPATIVKDQRRIEQMIRNYFAGKAGNRKS